MDGSALENITQALILGVAGFTIVQFLIQRNIYRFEVVAALSALAVPVLIGMFPDGVTSFRAIQIVTIVTLIAHPYLLLRLAARFYPFSMRIEAAVIVAMIASMVLATTFTLQTNTTLAAIIITDMMVVEAIASYLLVKASLTFRGVNRLRLMFAFAGSVTLAVVLGIAGLALIEPAAVAGLGNTLQIALAVMAALYFIAFGMPQALARPIQMMIFHSYLAQLSRMPVDQRARMAVDFLATTATSAAGGRGAMVILRSGPGGQLQLGSSDFEALEMDFKDDDPVLSAATRNGRPQIIELRHVKSEWAIEAATSLKANSLYVVPLTAGQNNWGAVVLFTYGRSLSPGDDAYLIQMIGEQCALGLDADMMMKNAEALARKADAANVAKSNFLASMSHELRTPLNAVIGFSELLSSGMAGPLEEKQERYVSNITTAGHHLLQLINDVLDLSRVEANRETLSRNSISVKAAVAEAVGVINPLIEKKSINLEQTIDDEVTSIFADPKRLRQILFNVLSNAIKFSPEGGNIYLDVAKGELPSGPADARCAVQVTVRDEGAGIDPDELSRVFEPFEQTESSYAREQEGTGLGLTLTKKFVEMHDGQISLTSEGRGKGVTVTILFPDVEATARPKIAMADKLPAADVTAEGERVKALVIDDDRLSREILGEYLQETGYECLFASNGEDGLALAKESPPSVILLDVIMDGLNGWDVLARLKADETTRDIPVVMITAVSEEHIGMAMGASGYLVKPIDKDTVISTVNHLVHPVGANQPRVLVVDDDGPTRELIGEVFEELGWQRRFANDGQEALDEITREKPDLVILDLKMPNMTGFEVLEKLKANDCADTDVIVVTGVELSEQEAEDLRRQVIEVYAKPMARAEFLERLQTHISQSTGKRNSRAA